MSEARVPVIEYNDFSARVHAQSNTRRFPMAGSLEVTYRCNFRCVHCYCIDEPAKRELSLDEVCSILDQMADAGCLWLLLTGGEPFLRKDFPDIYQYARARGMIVTVFTNGSLITEEHAEMLGSLKPFVVEITVYAATPETYAAVTGQAENFQKVIDGIERLQRHRVPLKLKSMIFRQNVHELQLIKSLAESRGLSYRFDPVISPSLAGNKNPTAHVLSPEEIVQLDLADNDRMDGWRDFCEKLIGPVKKDLLFKCGAGQWSFTVNPEGKLSLCSFAKKDQYDLRKGNFKEGFFDFLARVVSQKTTRVTKCSTCTLINLCGQCAAQAHLYSGDAEEPMEYLCAIAHARAKAFGLKSTFDSSGSKDS